MKKDMMLSDLTAARNEIDTIDDELKALLIMRMLLCRDIANYKQEHDLPVYDSEREQKLLDKLQTDMTRKDYSLRSVNPSHIPLSPAISKIFQALLEQSKDYQYKVIEENKRRWP